MDRQGWQKNILRMAENSSTVSSMRRGWIAIPLAGLFSVACSSGSPTTTLPSEEDTSAVSVLTSESNEVSPAPEIVEPEDLALRCIEILDVTPKFQVAPGDQIEIEIRCVFTSNPDRVRVTFGVGSDETTTVTADSIDGFLRKTVVATVPDGANDGPVEIKVGFLRSAISSVSIDIADPDPGVLWTGPGVELRVAEDLSQVFRFSFDLTGPDGCSVGGSINSPITVDPEGNFFVDGFADDISGEFTSATSASGTVDRGEGACVANWTASPQSSQPPTPEPSPTPTPTPEAKVCVTDAGDTATLEDLEALLSSVPSLITLTTGEIEITGPVVWTNGIASDPALELQAFFLGDPDRGPVDLMIDRFVDSSFSAEDVSCGSATQPSSSCEFELTLPNLGSLLSISGPADYEAVFTFFDGAGSSYACTKSFEFKFLGN